MKKIGYLLILILPFMVSCKKSRTVESFVTNDSLFQIITVNPDDINRKERSRISEIAESIEYIPLQTEDSILIGEVSKIIVWENKYYILDKLSETIFCFGSDGKYQNRIYRQGTGPDEYLRIFNFTIDRGTGNIVIYSDMGQGLYEYTSDGKFVKKTSVSFILSSFQPQGDRIYYYLGQSPNMVLYKDIFPESYRYLVLNDGEPQSQQLHYKYDDSFLQIPLSDNNFTFYGDTILLTEYLKPEIYWIDSIGNLTPRYRIEFTTNTYAPSFNENVDLERMNQEIKRGNLAQLLMGFYETSRYLFFNYSRGLIGMGYVDKKDNSIHNLGYFLLDDFNQNTLPASISFAEEGYMYKTVEADKLIMKNEKDNFSPYLKDICKNIHNFDNPIIIKIKLK